MIIALVQNPQKTAFYRAKRCIINVINHIGLASLAAGTLFAGWLLVQDMTKQHIIDDISNAIDRGNIHVLTKNIDWENVRNAMKRDLQHRSHANASLPQLPHEVSALVDYYVRPENIPALLDTYRQKASHMHVRDFVRRSYFSGLTEVTLELAAPPQFDKPWLNNQQPVRVVFHMRGMDWTLTRIEAPDYLIPTQALVLMKSDITEMSHSRFVRVM